MGKHQPEIIVSICKSCGAEIRARREKPLCKICEAAKNRLGAYLVGKKELPPDDELQTLFGAYRKSYLTVNGKQDIRRHEPRFVMPQVLNIEGRCRFCGAEIGSVFEDYCRPCVREGFDNVHRLTGRTGTTRARKKLISDNLKI